MQLFEIDEAIMNCVDMETGEIIDTETLEQLQMERDKKIEGIACWIKNLESDVEALKAQKQTFADRQRVAENKAASLKKFLTRYLDGQKFIAPTVAISFRKSKSVNIVDLAGIPEKYLKYADPTVNKTEVKKAIEAGEKIPGVELVENNNIQIK